MNFGNIGPMIKGAASRSAYIVKDHGPQILTGVSIGTSGVAIVLAIIASAKKLPEVQKRYNDALDAAEQEFTIPSEAAYKELEDIGEATIENIFDASNDGLADIETKRAHISNLQVRYKDGHQLETAAVAKAKAKRVGGIALIFLPTAICFGVSVGCSLTSLGMLTKKLLSAGAVITSLTLELANKNKRLKGSAGEDVVNKEDFKNAAPIIDDDTAQETCEMLYTRVYNKHLVNGMDVKDCVRMGQSQLLSYETVANKKLNSPYNHPSGIGRMYYGDVLRALDFPTDGCGQNTGWITRDYPSEYDGYIDFGCWIVDPVSGIKTLNPLNVDEDGNILLNFNVEGSIDYMLKEAKKMARFCPVN